ncbi:MAG: SpoIIE family protein phosphatase [Candidatus Sericytochromatia bacterium]|nr:SpoIIE family protein phosphatase [Candidatus Sericytochromatia bacterium]
MPQSPSRLSSPASARKRSLGFWAVLFTAFFYLLAVLGIRGYLMALHLDVPDLAVDAPIALLTALALARWARGRRAVTAEREGPAAVSPLSPDFRDIIGDFAAASRESLDVTANTDAFLDAVAESLTPAYQMVVVKGPEGGLETLGMRGVADPAALLRKGPSQEEVSIPLKVGDRMIGRLLLGPKVSSEGYTPGDFALLDALGQSLALSLRNAQLFGELAGQERLKRELEIACDVQMGLLPKSLPHVPGALVAAHCSPALEVGGDFYDFVQIDATRWGVLIGDVSGKGVPASLMMAVSLTLFRALAPGIPSPASTLGRLNKLIHRNRPSNKIFVAAVYFIYDARDGSVLLANAGHPPPLLDGQPVPAKGLPLGINPRVVYKEVRFTLPQGASLAVYSDGLEDLEDEQGVSLGHERVAALFQKVARMEPQTALENLRGELSTFAGKAPLPDDQTVAILQRQTTGSAARPTASGAEKPLPARPAATVLAGATPAGAQPDGSSDGPPAAAHPTPDGPATPAS